MRDPIKDAVSDAKYVAGNLISLKYRVAARQEKRESDDKITAEVEALGAAGGTYQIDVIEVLGLGTGEDS